MAASNSDSRDIALAPGIYAHIQDTNRGDVADMVKNGYSKETILAEIAKCDCLCANCHRILTYDERRSVV